MQTKNNCYTYFRMVGEFDPDEVSARLGLKPDYSQKIGDRRTDGKIFNCAQWGYGRCDEYDVEVEKQMQKTISGLLDKIDILNRIREDFNVSFYLEVVPEIYVDDCAPSLAPSLDVIDFCHATRTEIDIDTYIFPDDD